MLHMLAHTTRSAVAALVVAMFLPALLHAETSQAPDGLLPVEALSPGFLGMYRKVMEVEDDISKYADKYDVDLTLARALCIQESGGNANLNSWAGAKGYFQVMPFHIPDAEGQDEHRGGHQVLVADDPAVRP